VSQQDATISNGTRPLRGSTQNPAAMNNMASDQRRAIGPAEPAGSQPSPVADAATVDRRAHDRVVHGRNDRRREAQRRSASGHASAGFACRYQVAQYLGENVPGWGRRDS
jgi:hypothetical protein